MASTGSRSSSEAAPRMKPRSVYLKSAPDNAKGAVLVLRSLSNRDDADLMDVVCDLVEWGARPPLIMQLTGAARAAIERFCKREGRMRSGREPTSLAPLLTRPRIHIEASILLNQLMYFARLYEVRVDDPWALISAYGRYRMLVGNETQVSPEQGWLLAAMKAQGAALLSHCHTCSIYYLQSRDPLDYGMSLGCGECPYCRVLAPNREAGSASRMQAASQVISMANGALVSSPSTTEQP
jgi:hypothetical protein